MGQRIVGYRTRRRGNKFVVYPLIARQPRAAHTVQQTDLIGSKVEGIVKRAHEIREDRITSRLSYTDFLLDIPVDKLQPGEETFAEQHVGTRYGSRSAGPIVALYSPKQDLFQIINGHHRWAEAKAKGDRTIRGWVSVVNEERGFGAYTTEELRERGWLA